MRNLGQQFIRFRGHDRIRLEPVTILVFPGIQSPANANRLTFPSSMAYGCFGGFPSFGHSIKCWPVSGSAAS